jgi:uncharacterized protein (TIGR02145 family)
MGYCRLHLPGIYLITITSLNPKLTVMKKILSSLVLIVLISACKKTEQPIQQDQEMATESSTKKGGSSSLTVTTSAASLITSATATSGGNVSSAGGGNTVTERGVCYNTSPNPTIANTKVTSGSGSGDFVSVLLGLAGSTTYYVRAYATKSTGTTYGNQVVLTTLPDYGTITDYDGNVYHTITIGSQVWTVENLKTTHYRDGTPIPNVTDAAEWSNLITGAYCSYNNDDANVAIYGRLYNWYAVNDAHNLAPAGWHIPSYTEWYTALMGSLGGCGSSLSGIRLKDNILWNGDNSSGFKALPAGYRTSVFSSINSRAHWWLSNSISETQAWYFERDGYNGSCTISGGYYYYKKNGYAVRLVKD